MTTIQRIVKNTGVSGISQIAVSILTFILLIYTARYLGVAEFGNYNFAMSFTLLFTIFADIGISQLIIREIARNSHLTGKYFINASMIKILLSLVTFGSIIFIVNLMNYPRDVMNIIYLFGIYTILMSFAQMFMSIFQAFEKMEYAAVIMVTEKIVLIPLGLLVLSCGYGLTELAYVYVFAGAIDAIIGLALILTKIKSAVPKIDFSIWKKLTIAAIPFGLNSLFGMFFFKVDTILLYILKNDIAVGIYNAAYNPLLSFGGILSGMVVSAIYPVMSKQFISSKDSLGIVTVLTSKYLAIFGFPIAIICFILADKFIELFYAGQYSSSIIAFQILALFIPIRLVSSITGTLLTSINKQGIRTFSVFLSAIFNILLNLVMIPYLSYIGASIATVLSEIFLYFAYIHYINKYYKQLNLHKYFIKPLAASLIMGAIIFYFKEYNLFLLISLAFVVYFIVLIALKTFTSDDVKIFKQIVKKG